MTGQTQSEATGNQSLPVHSNHTGLTRLELRTPRAAAVAGILFSVLLFMALGLVRLSVPGDPFEPGAWLENGLSYVTLAMNLVPFAGIAFLWFVGVLRDRLGDREGRFFCNSLPRQRNIAAGDAFHRRGGGGRDHHSISCGA
jgi:hypothetical protein